MNEQIIGNFKLIEKDYIQELNSYAYNFVHEKTKAKLLYLENEDEIKTFSIGFRTPPEDSTGVAHIVEHCVLSGSRKYRTKEPFMNMVNSSMQTFLNAMTFPDKTMYPIATRNEKDFYNLMDVYLDAVLYPRIYEVKQIFEQEGWHLELNEKDGELLYNGVVYNEMRGAYSDPDDQVSELLSQKLHPNSTYDHDSGGNPHVIPDLTYEDFLDFHSRYYHPSNSYIFLNGNMNIKEVLEYIDREFLDNFEYSNPNSDIIMNEKFSEAKTIETEFSIGKDDPIENKSYFAYGVDLGESSNSTDNFMRSILRTILIESDSSVLKDVLLDSGLGEDYYSITSSSLPLDFFIVAKNTDSKKLNEFVEIIENELKNVVSNGIDKDLIQGALNNFEFSLKDLGIHKGVMLAISAMSGWLYGASPIESLKFSDSLEYIKSNLEDGFVEKYIEEKILNNPNKIYLVAKPVPGQFLEKDEEMKERLRKYKESLSDDEIEKLIEDTENLIKYQETPDTQEDKDTIPKLELDDISPGINSLKTDVSTFSGINTLFVDEFTNNIFYMTMAFNMKNLTSEELPYGGLVVDLLSSLDTENYSYRDLSNQIDIQTGGIKIASAAYEDTKSKDYNIFLTINSRALPEKISNLFELIEELILKTKFENVKRIKDLLIIAKSDLESSIEQGGHQFIAAEISSMMKDSAAITNILGGRKYLFFLKEVIEKLETNPEEVLNNIKEVYKKIFNKNFVISVAGEKSWYDESINWISGLKTKLSNFHENLDFTREKLDSIAIKSSSNVVYVSEGFNFEDYGFKFNGKMAVLSKILSGDYLHTQIRAIGGAYGAGISINQKGNVITYSYRDPNLDKTFEVYENIPSYLKNTEIDSRDLTNYIISTMNLFDPPRTPSQYTALALSKFFTKLSDSDVEKLKQEAIETTPEDIKNYAEMFENAKDKKYYGVLGSTELIKESKKTYEKEYNL